MTPAHVTWRQVTRWRLRRQMLAAPAQDAVDVASRLAGLHAQVASCTHLITGVRTTGLPDLQDLLWRERRLVRTWGPRGTLHLLPASELDLWVAALADRAARQRLPASLRRALAVNDDQQRAIIEAIGVVLDATPLSRAELARAVCAHLGDPALHEPLVAGWGVLLKPAAARGLLCSGPTVDGAVSFVDPEPWIGRRLQPIDAGYALRHVLLRFLGSAGPVTVEDLAHWWGDRPAWVQRWIRDNAGALAQVTVDGDAGYIMCAEDVDELRAVAAEEDGGSEGALLLPGFDPWIVAPLSHRRQAIPVGRAAAVSRAAGWISPVLWVDGTVGGVWRHSLRRGSASVTVELFGPLSHTSRRAVERHAERHGALLGADDISVTFV